MTTTRRLGRSGIAVGAVCVDTWAIGGPAARPPGGLLDTVPRDRVAAVGRCGVGHGHLASLATPC